MEGVLGERLRIVVSFDALVVVVRDNEVGAEQITGQIVRLFISFHFVKTFVLFPIGDHSAAVQHILDLQRTGSGIGDVFNS